MAAGQLDQRVTLFRRDIATSTSGSGAQLEQFVDAGTVWARVTPIGGAEAFGTAERMDAATQTFRIRYRADVTQLWRLEWIGRRYDITQVLPAGHRLREWLDITATAGIAENPES